METLMAVVVGVLYAAGIYLMLQRSLLRLVLGLSILGNGANLLIFTAGGLVRGNPPLVPRGGTVPAAPFADPVPQALILTAIVIGFGVLAFALVLVYRTVAVVGSDDVDAIRGTDPTTGQRTDV